MGDKNTVFILQKAQFGYHTTTYMFCKYLRKYYRVIYLCIDAGKPKVDMEGVEVVYSPTARTVIERGFGYLTLCKKMIKSQPPSAVFAVYFPGVSLLPKKKETKVILDVRSGKISTSWVKRLFFDKLLWLETHRFQHVAVISESLRKRLNIAKKKSYILPIAADVLSKKEKQWNELNLLYVGALNFRNIHQTIEGCALFGAKHREAKWTYNIVAYGTAEVEASLKESVLKHGLQNHVFFHGRKTHAEIQHLWDNCNVGVAYIPQTSYFDCQPPTKTYEYLQSGMICLATNTHEHRLLINSQNGILHDANPNAFAHALEKMYLNKGAYASNTIRHTIENHTWSKIVENYLIPLLAK